MRQSTHSYDETCTKRGAMALANKIVGFWAREGHKVRAWAEFCGRDMENRPLYGVRTDMVNGFPSVR